MKAARTILIVDDSARMREVIARCCTGPNDIVIQASNGSEAVERFLRHQPDWTIMDVQMPQMNGFAATRDILRQSHEARVIIVTQHDTPDYRQEARSAGACGFVSKDDLSRLIPLLEGAAGSALRTTSFPQTRANPT